MLIAFCDVLCNFEVVFNGKNYYIHCINLYSDPYKLRLCHLRILSILRPAVAGTTYIFNIKISP